MMTLLNVLLIVIGIGVLLVWIASVFVLESWFIKGRRFLNGVQSSKEMTTAQARYVAVNEFLFSSFIGLSVIIFVQYFVLGMYGGSDAGWNVLNLILMGFGVIGIFLVLTSLIVIFITWFEAGPKRPTKTE